MIAYDTKLAGVAILAAVALLTAGPASAQSVSAAVADLRDNDVTFEEGAVDDQDLAELDDAAADLQSDDGYFKIVVLANRVEDFPSTRAFAQQVLAGLGGDGRVLVYDPASLGVASNVDSQSEIAQAEAAAVDEANRTDSFAEGARAAGSELGVEVATDGDDGGGGSGFIWLIVIAAVGIGAVLLFRTMMRKGRKEEAELDAAALGVGERKVRDAVDQAANLVLELSDPVERPDAPAAARDAYRQGSSEFMAVQDELEQADTRAELEAVYPKIVNARWRLETAKALLDGQPPPAEPSPEPLFPAPPVPAPRAPDAPAPAPEPQPQGSYRSFDVSPWLTQAAMAAISVLASQGFGGGGRHRQPMDDDVFGGLFPSGGGGSSRGRGRPRISLGRGSGRGMGSR